MTRDYRLLSHHRSQDLVAFGAAGEKDRRALLDDVARLSARLAPHPGDVAISTEDRYHLAVALLALWRLGRRAALPPNARPATLAWLCEEGGVAELLDDTRLRELLEAKSPTTGAPLTELEGFAAPQRLATVYTSGSTGDFQPVDKSAGQLLGEADNIVTTFALRRGSTVVATVPGHHIYGLLFSVLAPLLCGGAFLRETPLHAETVARQVREHQAETLVSTPIHLRSFTVLDRRALAPVERLFSSAAPLSAETAAALVERQGLRPTEIFGSTETGGVAWREDTAAPWRPFEGVAIESTGDDHLRLRSPFLPSREAYTCADRIELVEGGFRHLGRSDGVLKIGGRRISLSSLEHHLLSLEGVQDAAVVVLGERERGPEVGAAVVAPSQTPAALREALGAWVDQSALPRQLVVVDALPTEPTGKRRQSALRALFEAPGEPIETEVALERLGEEPWAQGRELHYRANVPPRFYTFEGHFPDLPVLPAVSEMHDIVLAAIHREEPHLGSPRRLQKLKFQRLIRPGDTLSLRLRRYADAPRVDFWLTTSDEGHPVASGRLFFDGERP